MKTKKQQILRCMVFILGGLILSPPVIAANLQVTPTSLDFTPGDQAHELWLINSGTEALQAQVRLFKWTQSPGEDILQASQDFALSPAMISVQPGQKQLVRVIRRTGVVTANQQAEESFRILVDELPIDTATDGVPGVQFVFRYSLPLFVSHTESGNNDHVSQVTWSYKSTASGLFLKAHNPGRKHIQIGGLELIAGQQSLQVSQRLFAYVLAGQTRVWPIETENSALVTIDRVRATLNGENIDTAIVAWSDSD